nr:ABC transporter ATP-binding protein [uncultured Cupriavidus sp.]
MSNLLQIEGLKAGYGRSQVLFDVSLDLAPGEAVTLLGRNGMGRSTTVSCLFGLLPVQGGSIRMHGHRIENKPSHRIARRGLGLVPEGRHIFPLLSVEENLLATARDTRVTGRWTLDEVYRFFPRLRERKQNLGTQLSGGEQQMLAIGRALMTNPEILVLDEATEGLAPVVRDEIWAALQQLKTEGMSMVVIDKNIAALMRLADRHYIIEKGVTVWSGTSESLKSDETLIPRYLGV